MVTNDSRLEKIIIYSLCVQKLSRELRSNHQAGSYARAHHNNKSVQD